MQFALVHYRQIINYVICASYIKTGGGGGFVPQTAVITTFVNL